MLPRCDDPAPLRVVGIDPGSDTLGVSVLDVCLITNSITWMTAQTYHGSKMAREYRFISDVHGDKVARLHAHEENLFAQFQYWKPHEIISEAPYLGRFPAAYAALVECMTAIRNAVRRYDFIMPLITADPPTVKKNLGVNGKSGDKTLMTAGIIGLLNTGALQNPHGIDISLLDEHSIDSTAVAYLRARYVIERNVFQPPAPNYRFDPTGRG